MATKSPEATIDFLLCCIECVEGKVNWEDVAIKTGWYKSGKFSKQAYTSLQKKYGGTVIGTSQTANAEASPKTPKKRGLKVKTEENGSCKKVKTETDEHIKDEDHEHEEDVKEEEDGEA